MKSQLLKVAIVGFLFSITSCINAANKNEKSSEPVGEVIHLTYDEFTKRVADIKLDTWKYVGDKPCILDFYATWCGPCKMISPHLEALAKSYAGKIYIYKIDVDKERELGQAFGAFSIPTLIFIPKNGEPQMTRGYMEKADLQKAIETVLLENK